MLDKQTRAIDSLQIMIFVYHRRFMRDQESIQLYRTKMRDYKLHKPNKLVFPKYLGKDSLKYNFRNEDDSLYYGEEDYNGEEYDTTGYINDTIL